MSVPGTSATCVRLAALSEVHLEADISPKAGDLILTETHSILIVATEKSTDFIEVAIDGGCFGQ